MISKWFMVRKPSSGAYCTRPAEPSGPHRATPADGVNLCTVTLSIPEKQRVVTGLPLFLPLRWHSLITNR